MTLCGDVIDAVDAQLVNGQGGVVEPAPIFTMLGVHNFELGAGTAGPTDRNQISVMQFCD